MIVKECKCGEIYKFKDEMVDEEVYCPKCENRIKIFVMDKYFNVFSRDKFLINQKHFAVAEKYYILGENEEPLLYAERPKKYFRFMLGILVGVIASFIICGVVIGMLQGVVGETMAEEESIIGMIGFAAIGLTIFIAAVIYGKKNIYIYKDDTKEVKVLTIEQENLFQFIKGKYRVLDENNILIAKLEKNYIYNFIRKRWYWKSGNDEAVAIIKEESLILAILRKLTGTLFGILRSNFIFQNNMGKTFGEFNRKISIRDKYMLDLSNDKNRLFDRKICVAMGILLDTGERR